MPLPLRTLALLLAVGGAGVAGAPKVPGPRLALPPHLSVAVLHDQEALSKLRAMELFPDIEKEGSPLHRRIDEEMAKLQTEAPETFEHPDWPMTVARYCAGCLSIKPKSIADLLRASPKKSLLHWDQDAHFLDLVIRHADYAVGGVELDVTRKLQAMVDRGTLEVKCDDALLPDLADGADGTREQGETGQEFWKRHLAALEASTKNDPTTKHVLKVIYERQGEIHSAEAAYGTTLRIGPPAAVAEAGSGNEPAPAKDAASGTKEQKTLSVFSSAAEIAK